MSDDITKVCKSWELRCLRAEARVGGRVQSARRRAAVVQGTTEQPGRLFLVSEKDFGDLGGIQLGRGIGGKRLRGNSGERRRRNARFTGITYKSRTLLN